MSSIRSLLGVIIVLSVNTSNIIITDAWLTPTTTSVTFKPIVARTNPVSSRHRIETMSSWSLRPLSSSSSNNRHNLQSTRYNNPGPRHAVEILSESEISTEKNQSSEPLETLSSSTTTTTSPQQIPQQPYHLSILESSHIKTFLGSTTNEDDGLSLQQRFINLLFLSVAFGYAIYTIVNIDSGMTRGWTVQEQVMRIPLDNWGAYESYLANKPIVTKTLINVIIYLLGDWLSQTAFQRKHVLDFDISRTLRNGFIGLCFGPLVHQYYEFSDAILPPENGLITRLEKILMDQTIYLTVKCSIYISAVGLLNGEDWLTVKQTVKDKIGGIVLTAWKFWPIVHCITYSLIPAQHRILWVNSVDLVWNAILATQAQRKESVFEELPEEENTDLSALADVSTVSIVETDDNDHTNKHESVPVYNDTVPTLEIENDVIDILQISSNFSEVNITTAASSETVTL